MVDENPMSKVAADVLDALGTAVALVDADSWKSHF